MNKYSTLKYTTKSIKAILENISVMDTMSQDISDLSVDVKKALGQLNKDERDILWKHLVVGYQQNELAKEYEQYPSAISRIIKGSLLKMEKVLND